jgi:hypothetical protein
MQNIKDKDCRYEVWEMSLSIPEFKSRPLETCRFRFNGCDKVYLEAPLLDTGSLRSVNANRIWTG